MGQEISSYQFAAEDYERFKLRLYENLHALKLLLQRDDFGIGDSSFGAELEMYLVDDALRPLGINESVKKASNDPRVALELNRFNLEYNFTPVAAAGTPFTQLESEMKQALARLNKILVKESGKVMPIGILPTLKRSDFGLKVMTDEQRFYALTEALQKMRGRMFTIRIEGEEPISLRAHDVTLEGANTSLQIHFRINPDRFACTFNSLQLVTPVLLGLAANSPYLLGQHLWQETRIPLFQQTIDGRSGDECNRSIPSRVEFGNGWVREGAYELFAETVHLHEPILPVSCDEDSLALVAAGGVPKLNELCLHCGTVWPWNRPVYDAADGGHLRIELRALPAGPAPVDMIANAAFALGVAKGLQEHIDEIIPALPFRVLSNNFYHAARLGIRAELMWPAMDGSYGLHKKNIQQIAKELLPIASIGLQQLGVADEESSYYLNIIENRLDRGVNGAVWQCREYRRLSKHHPHATALAKMCQNYLHYSERNIPVADWPHR